MKAVVDRLRGEGLIFQSLHPVDPKALGSRKKIAIYEGVDLKKNYVAIFVYQQKSRFLRKDIEPLEALLEQLKNLLDHNFKIKILLYDMPICSHAKKELEELGWRVIHVAG